MKISGFTMVKNADKLYYPIKQSILSILPIVDEFVVALGDCDVDDETQNIIESICSSKVKIVHTVWDTKKFPNGMENAHQTDIAKNHCTGDWLFYLQADEVVHEKYLPAIKKRCEELVDDKEVEGLLFSYKHFWGDYNHYVDSHGWYPHEIRIVRNDKDIHSWESAQSFRRIPDFDEKNYRQQNGTAKLKVATVAAEVFHYGWVRPPALMQSKKKSLDTIHKGKEKAEQLYKSRTTDFKYGPLKKVPVFNGTHPAVMKNWIENFNWSKELDYSGNSYPERDLFKHERLKYRLLTFLEKKFLGGKHIGGFKNHILLNK